MNRIVLITGATSGFGKATAIKFASEGFNCIITGRREERLKQLSEELSSRYSVDILPLSFDIRDRKAVQTAIESIPAQWQSINILINNAGLAAGRDYFEEASLDDWDNMIDTNVKGLLYISKLILPFLIAGKNGHIINIGSTAGKEVYEKGNVYCASKHAVDAITKSMRIDLLRHGIKVTGIHPGAAETEFSMVRLKGNEEAAKKVYEGYQALRAEDLADIIYYTTTLPAHVCLNDIVVTCTAQANSFYLNRK
ncbi:MAG: SDR family NAD(P)-dependent oxidoreductase [Gemmatimonadaceae bacterium]|nr:SDR family NAD(P)-dependent oxidoreductase [Chitinophagaceae bacterium]